jgi:hypothetical protein
LGHRSPSPVGAPLAPKGQRVVQWGRESLRPGASPTQAPDGGPEKGPDAPAVAVPKTDTGGQTEQEKANGRPVPKELGKLAPDLAQGCPRGCGCRPRLGDIDRVVWSAFGGAICAVFPLGCFAFSFGKCTGTPGKAARPPAPWVRGSFPGSCPWPQGSALPSGGPSGPKVGGTAKSNLAAPWGWAGLFPFGGLCRRRRPGGRGKDFVRRRRGPFGPLAPKAP